MHDVNASAPGRVNLIGEHTDYNGGLVLPMPIPQRTRVELRAGRDHDSERVDVTSREIAGANHYRIGEERRRGSWLDYVMGCTAALRAAGHSIGGCELAIASDVPLGSGLSSSAALEIAVLRAFREAFALPIDDLSLALIGQHAENDLVGVPCGAMDQLAASLGMAGAALFIDTQTLATRRVALPSSIEVVVIDSDVPHDHAANGYRKRRAECEQAAQLLGVSSLRELETSDLDRLVALPITLARRVRHVVTENARVIAAVVALEHADVAALRTLFAASHASLRDDYEVSVPELDLLVELAVAQPDIVGARMTGGGFGGSIVALANAGTGAAAAAKVSAAYRERTDRRPRILLPEVAA